MVLHANNALASKRPGEEGRPAGILYLSLDSERIWCCLRSVVRLSRYHFLWPTHVHRRGLIRTDDTPSPGMMPLDVQMQCLFVELWKRMDE